MIGERYHGVSNTTLRRVREALEAEGLTARDLERLRRLSQRELGERLGLHQTTIGKALRWLRFDEG